MAVPAPYQPQQQQQYQQQYGQVQYPQPYGGQQKQGFGDKVSELFFGREGRNQLNPILPQHQMMALDQILGGGLQSLQNPYAGFEPLAQQTTNDFYQNIIPGLAERFTAAGGGGQRSSAFQGALGNAGSGLAAMLNAQRSQYGLQNRQLGLQQSELGLRPQYESQYIPGSSGIVQDILPLLAEAGLLYATGGLSGAPAIAKLFGQGIDFGKKTYNNFNKPRQLPTQQAPQNAYQYQQNINQNAESSRAFNRSYPALASRANQGGFGQTFLEPRAA